MNTLSGYAALAAAVVSSTLFALPASAATVHHIDFIDDAQRTHFNGFEGLPNVPSTLTTNYTYVENGIRVEQVVNPNYYDSTAQITVSNLVGGQEGANAWYPNCGDYGYTRISMEDGSDFGRLGLLVGSGGPSHTRVMFELYNDGDLVDSGYFDLAYLIWYTQNFEYLGFSGETFDTVWLRTTSPDLVGVSFLDGNLNALSLDSIEVTGVPLPASAWLMMSGLFALTKIGASRRT